MRTRLRVFYLLGDIAYMASLASLMGFAIFGILFLILFGTPWGPGTPSLSGFVKLDALMSANQIVRFVLNDVTVSGLLLRWSASLFRAWMGLAHLSFS